MTDSPPPTPFRLAIAAGGTGGHVGPALAVVDELRSRQVLADLLWIGSDSGIERDAAARAAIPFATIPTGKLRRYFSLRTLADAGRIPLGIAQARRLLRRFSPDIVLSTGGFVSVPTVLAAAGLAPVLTHEQTAILGLATRINCLVAAVLAVSFDDTATLAKRTHARVVVTGNPVRPTLSSGDAARARVHWGFTPDLPLLYVTGGARGASALNRRLAALLPDLLDHCQILHQAGPATANDDAAQMERLRQSWPSPARERYRVVEFVADELPDLYAAADLILSRAGAGTIAELALLAKPAVLIPLPGAGGDEQTRNARLLAAAGGAVLLPQAEATPDRLRVLLTDLLTSPERRRQMGAAAARIARPDASARLADELTALAAHSRR